MLYEYLICDLLEKAYTTYVLLGHKHIEQTFGILLRDDWCKRHINLTHH